MIYSLDRDGVTYYSQHHVDIVEREAYWAGFLIGAVGASLALVNIILFTVIWTYYVK